MNSRNKTIMTEPLSDIPEFLTGQAQVGSAANQEMIQTLVVRLVIDSIDAISSGTRQISASNDRLSDTIQNIADTSKATSAEVIKLNKSLGRATWAIAALTGVLALLGLIQVLF